MSGIALIIPNADYSDSPLGKVTFKKTVAEMVNEYATKIGTDEYNTHLSSMLFALADLGVINDIDVYPMLGDSFSKLKVNLLSKSNIPETEWRGRDLVFGANASVFNGYVSITMAPTGSVDNHDIDVNISDSPYIYTDIKYTTRAGQIYTNRDTTNILVGLNDECARFVANGRDYQSSVNVYNQRLRIGCSSNIAGLDIFVNEEKSTQLGAADENNLTFTDVIGPKSSNVLDAKLYFFAKGLIPQTKVGSLNTIFKDFLTAVKPEV